MQAQSLDEIIEAIYASPLDDEGWREVMRLLHARFGSNMEALYFLDFGEQRTRIVELQGVTSNWVRQFSSLYFCSDNPWARYTATLHRPGTVRTSERLAQLTGDPGILRRSTYFNEWMHPQCFAHTMGVTPYSRAGVVANISLFRPPDMSPFGDADVAAMQTLSPHFQRALAFGLRLEADALSGQLGLAALDTLSEGVALVDERLMVQHANPALERWLRDGRVLALDAGRLRARLPQASQALAALVADAALGLARRPDGAELVGSDGHRLNVKAMPVRIAAARYLAPRGCTLLIFSEPVASRGDTLREIGDRYRLTRAELRLALHLLDGIGLRDAAARCGIGYGTARGYLKILFQKTGTHRQAELVALLLGREANTASPGNGTR